MRDSMNNGGGRRDVDSLRLVALSRIPRCASCPRFHALYRAYESSAMLGNTLPMAPSNCHHQVCGPMVHRFTGPVRFLPLREEGLHGAA